MIEVLDAEGNVVNRSKNMRGLRRLCRKWVVQSIRIGENDDSSGNLLVAFEKHVCEVHFASFDVLKLCLRNWTNLRGVPLFINGVESGVVNYRNSSLCH